MLYIVKCYKSALQNAKEKLVITNIDYMHRINLADSNEAIREE